MRTLANPRLPGADALVVAPVTGSTCTTSPEGDVASALDSAGLPDVLSGRVLIVSNRLPVTRVEMEGEATLVPSCGGLATGLERLHRSGRGLWIGWNGDDEPVDASVASSLDSEFVSRRLRPVPLSRAEVGDFYEHIANGVLWPAFHDQLEQLPHVVEGWDTYEAVNRRFADVVVDCYRPGDIIWAHDYHLLRLPALVRARLPDARIGLFLHIPFPGPEIFFALPRRRWLVEGMLGANVIGFHTAGYAAHFVAVYERLFAGEDAAHPDDAADAADTPGAPRCTRAVRRSLRHEGRDVRVGVFPMGVDAAAFADRAGDREVVGEMMRLRAERGVRILVGIDRLDYTKGLPRRLLALERLLIRYPQWREHVRLVQVAVPSRENVPAYRQVRHSVEQLVGRINGQLGTQRWTPIRYLYQSVSDVALSALYRAADAMLVTPLRDGMNLVAKEFVASRTDGDGVLVLSEFAGAADELTGALMVNPYDVDGMADAFHRALLLPRDERRSRMRAMRDCVLQNDVAAWAREFLGALQDDPLAHDQLGHG